MYIAISQAICSSYGSITDGKKIAGAAASGKMGRECPYKEVLYYLNKHVNFGRPVTC